MINVIFTVISLGVHVVGGIVSPAPKDAPTPVGGYVIQADGAIGGNFTSPWVGQPSK